MERIIEEFPTSPTVTSISSMVVLGLQGSLNGVPDWLSPKEPKSEQWSGGTVPLGPAKPQLFLLVGKSIESLHSLDTRLLSGMHGTVTANVGPRNTTSTLTSSSK